VKLTKWRVDFDVFISEFDNGIALVVEIQTRRVREREAYILIYCDRMMQHRQDVFSE